jgi:hypothetical protein
VKLLYEAATGLYRDADDPEDKYRYHTAEATAAGFRLPPDAKPLRHNGKLIWRRVKR